MQLFEKKPPFTAINFCFLLVLTALPFCRASAQDINYQVYQSPDAPVYEIVFRQMREIFRDDEYYWDSNLQEWITYPPIGIAEIDLTGDNFPELIAYVMEDDVEQGLFCELPTKCPHYILEVVGNEVKNKGIISTYTIMPDKEFVNGYRRLRVYTKDPEIDPYYFVYYAYDPEREAYVPSP